MLRIQYRPVGSGVESLREIENQAVAGKREKDTARNHRPKDSRKAATFSDMKPVCIHLDDGHRRKALEIHIRRVHDRQR